MTSVSSLGNNVTLLFYNGITYLERGTPVGGQFGWGGTLLKRYQ